MESISKTNCCAAVNNALGAYYYDQSLISEKGAETLNTNFSQGVGSELTARGQLIFAFLQDLNVAILAKFASIDLCKRSSCCA